MELGASSVSLAVTEFVDLWRDKLEIRESLSY